MSRGTYYATAGRLAVDFEGVVWLRPDHSDDVDADRLRLGPIDADPDCPRACGPDLVALVDLWRDAIGAAASRAERRAEYRESRGFR